MHPKPFGIARTNFTAVAAALGCDDTTAHTNCLRDVPWKDVEAALSADPTLNLLPIVDNHFISSNYSDPYSINALP
jgi:hypothetical protein